MKLISLALLASTTFAPQALANAATPTFSSMILSTPLAVSSGGLGNATGDASALTVFSRSLSARAGELVNVRDSGALGDGATDDSAAFATAIGLVNSRAALGIASCLYLPPGQYVVNANHLTQFVRGGGVCGAGSWKSVVLVGPSYSGDLFAWSGDAWFGSMDTPGTWVITNPQNGGVRAEGVTVIGKNAYSSTVNAFVFYDNIDLAHIHDIDVETLNGRGVYVGAAFSASVPYMRESRFDHVRIFNSGAAGLPAFEITAQCTAGAGPCSNTDSTNELDLSEIDIYGARGPSFVIRNAMPYNGGTLRSIRISKLRIEGTEGNTNGVTADLMTIGDAAMSGPINGVSCVQCEIVSPYTNYPGLRITGATAATAPNNIQFQGSIGQGGGGGAGLRIDAGFNIAFDGTIATSQTGVTIASSATVSGPIIIDNAGNEGNFSWSVDPSVYQFLSNRRGMFGIPISDSGHNFLSAQRPDNTIIGGAWRGPGSTDWQTTRFSYVQAATGPGATISGGTNSAAGGDHATVAGGLTNNAAGWLSSIGGGNANIAGAPMSAIPGGQQASVSDYGMMAFASGSFVSAGDAQIGWTMLRAATASTTATRLTADGSGTVNANNTLNIPANSAWLFDLDCVYRDTTTGAVATWYFYHVLMAQGATAATTTVSAPGATAGPTSGSPGASAPTLGADTTNGGLALTFTAPNTHADHIACGVIKLIVVK